MYIIYDYVFFQCIVAEINHYHDQSLELAVWLRLQHFALV